MPHICFSFERKFFIVRSRTLWWNFKLYSFSCFRYFVREQFVCRTSGNIWLQASLMTKFALIWYCSLWESMFAREPFLYRTSENIWLKDRWWRNLHLFDTVWLNVISLEVFRILSQDFCSSVPISWWVMIALYAYLAFYWVSVKSVSSSSTKRWRGKKGTELQPQWLLTSFFKVSSVYRWKSFKLSLS